MIECALFNHKIDLTMDLVHRLIQKSYSHERLSRFSPPKKVSSKPPVYKVNFFPEVEVEYLPAWSEFELDGFKKELWWKEEDYEKMLSSSTKELENFTIRHQVTFSQAKHMLYQPAPEQDLDQHSKHMINIKS